MHDKKDIPPKLAKRLLNWFVRDDLAEEVLGDLEERFNEDIKGKSLLQSKLNYWYQTINYLRPFAIRKSTSMNPMNYSMHRIHFKIFFRNVKRQKSTFLINIIGLSTGLACAMLIALWVFDELSVDKFHENEARLYQVVETPEIDGRRVQNPSTAGLVAETMAQEFPEIEKSTGVRETAEFLFSHEENQPEGPGTSYADPEFFDVFSFQPVEGDKRNILSNKNSVVLSEDMATRLLGSTDNANRQSSAALTETGRSRSREFWRNVPNNSTIQFDFVLPFELFKEMSPNTLNWDYNTTNVYLGIERRHQCCRIQFQDKGFYRHKDQG